jgi:hypothetical protein
VSKYTPAMAFYSCFHLLLVALWVYFSTSVVAQAPSVYVHNAVGSGVKDTYSAIRLGPAAVNLEKREGFKSISTLQKR